MLLVCGFILFSSLPCRAEQRGRRIYLEQCAGCHGMQGEGNTQQFSDPLMGDLPLTELVRLIAETMPADSPEKCVGPGAEQVARYIYDAFP